MRYVIATVILTIPSLAFAQTLIAPVDWFERCLADADEQARPTVERPLCHSDVINICRYADRPDQCLDEVSGHLEAKTNQLARNLPDALSNPVTDKLYQRGLSRLNEQDSQAVCPISAKEEPSFCRAHEAMINFSWVEFANSLALEDDQ